MKQIQCTVSCWYLHGYPSWCTVTRPPANKWEGATNSQKLGGVGSWQKWQELWPNESLGGAIPSIWVNPWWAWNWNLSNLLRPAPWTSKVFGVILVVVLVVTNVDEPIFLGDPTHTSLASSSIGCQVCCCWCTPHWQRVKTTPKLNQQP